MYALIQHGLVSELFEADPRLPAPLDVRDVSGVPGIAAGWLAHVDGTYAAESAAVSVSDLLAYASARQNAVLAGVWTFNVAAQGTAAHPVTTRLDDRGQFAMMKVQGWLQLNAANPSATMPYSNVDFSATSLTVAEADSLVEQAAKLDEQGYTILNQVADAVKASPPTVTSFAEIDAAFAALAPAA